MAPLGQVIKTATQRAQKDFFAVWKRSWKIAVPLTLFFEALELFFGAVRDSGQPGADVIAQIGLVLISLAWPLTWVLIVPKYAMDVRTHAKTRSLSAHFRKYFSQVCIESLRVFGRVAVGVLLLVVPGIIRGLRLYFVPLTVQFDPAYERGERDALEESEALVKGWTWQLTGFLLVCVAVAWTPMLLKYYVPPEINPVLYSLLVLLGLCAEIFTDIAILDLYFQLTKNRMEVNTHGSSL